jgi:hypothetical protein
MEKVVHFLKNFLTFLKILNIFLVFLGMNIIYIEAHEMRGLKNKKRQFSWALMAYKFQLLSIFP